MATLKIYNSGLDLLDATLDPYFGKECLRAVVLSLSNRVDPISKDNGLETLFCPTYKLRA